MTPTGIPPPDGIEAKPWQKFQPSPSDASPTASILKRAMESPAAAEMGCTDVAEGIDTLGSATKRHRVKFTDPPVSEQVEIPRSQLGGCGNGGANILGAVANKTSPSTLNINIQSRVPQRQESSKSIPPLMTKIPPLCENGSISEVAIAPAVDSATNDDVGNDEWDKQSDEKIYPTLSDKSKGEPIVSILSNLTNKTFYRTAMKCLEDNKVKTVADLCEMTIGQVKKLKGLKPPNNITTVKEALKKFEKLLQKREIINNANMALYTKPIDELVCISDPPSPKALSSDDVKASKLATAPFMEVTLTPDEEDKTMKEIYERPSPSPTESEQDAADKEKSMVLHQQYAESVEMHNVATLVGGIEVGGINGSEPAVNLESSISLISDGRNLVESMRKIDMSSGQKELAFDKGETISFHMTDKNEIITSQPQSPPLSDPQNEILKVASQLSPPPQILGHAETLATPTEEVSRMTARIVETNATEQQENESLSEESRAKSSYRGDEAVSQVSVDEGCQAVVESSHAEIQTAELTVEMKLEKVLELFGQLDAKTLAVVIGKGHSVLQEKLTQFE